MAGGQGVSGAAGWPAAEGTGWGDRGGRPGFVTMHRDGENLESEKQMKEGERKKPDKSKDMELHTDTQTQTCTDRQTDTQRMQSHSKVADCHPGARRLPSSASAAPSWGLQLGLGRQGGDISG
jgi:hypothetical protein